MPTRQGSIRLFKLFGITVYLHWAWFIAIFYFISQAKGYSSPVWSVAECLSLFLIVLMHEFGHQLACRSVGGQTHDIVLWPLGGVAYVTPPPRPGAQLWSIAAGPLVNVILFPLLAALWLFAKSVGWYDIHHDAYNFVFMLFWINTVLLIFNMLPIYPLDGGQILRSLLWFICGRANSLMAASIIGFIGVAGLILFALWARDQWLILICVFIVLNCWGGLMQARALAKVAKAPHREGFHCPECKTAPPVGNFWRCSKCTQPFDTFETRATCPHCGVQFSVTACPECGSLRPIQEWENFVQPPQT
jgi:Zn-dependent protease